MGDAWRAWSRRGVLRAGLVLGAMGVLPTEELWALDRMALERWLRGVPLDELDPFGPPDRYATFRPIFFDAGLGRVLVDRLWRAYRTDGALRIGEWTLVYFYIWWRALRTHEQRLKGARIARRMADAVRRAHPDSPVGPVWGAVYVGLEIVERGILNALHEVPEYLDRLEAATRIDPAYFFGLAHLLRAKAYLKLPPFPISLGDPAKAKEALDAAEPYARERFTAWYLTWAELALVRHGLENEQGRRACFRWLARMEREVRPIQLHQAYDVEVATREAEALRRAVRSGTYDRYTWDPSALEMAE